MALLDRIIKAGAADEASAEAKQVVEDTAKLRAAGFAEDKIAATVKDIGTFRAAGFSEIEPQSAAAETRKAAR